MPPLITIRMLITKRGRLIAQGTFSHDKGRKIEAVAAATVRLLWHHGIAAVTHTRLARAASVSRSWLYKYVGPEREDLLRFVTAHFGAMLAKSQTRPRVDTKEHWIADTVQGAFLLMEQADEYPWVLPLYYRYLGTDNVLGKYIADVEAHYLDTAAGEIEKVFGMSKQRARWTAELLLSVRAGIAFRHALTGFSDRASASDLEALLTSWSRAL